MTDVVFDTVVEDGRLEITLDAEHEDPAKRSWAINGMVVLPATTPEEQQFADAKIEQIRATFERLKQEAFEQNFVEMDYPEYGEMVEPTDADRARGFIGWAPNWMEYIYLHAVPTAETAGRELAATATPGEYEPITVAVHLLGEVGDLTVEASDIGPIAADSVDIRHVRYMRARPNYVGMGLYRIVPDVLEPMWMFHQREIYDPAAPVGLDAGVTHRFWLTLKVPEDAQPGIYEGSVTVRDDRGGVGSVPVRLRVLPFKLQDDPE